jgi:exonuclease SbcC
MKPIKLAITAFGPFASTQVIDFRPLNDRSFFLIHGPTGAGKTTILDAICFALYGETSGNARKGEQMRSHHAEISILTEVTFDFMLGQEVFRVTRSLKHENSLENKTEILFKPDKAILWKRIEVENDSSEGMVLASKWKKVTERIEGLLGFESTQFRQVILLPQDQFQKLLMATSQAREDLLKTLFQTEKFERIEKALKDEAKHLTDELRNLTEKRNWTLGEAKVTTPNELVEKRKAIVKELSTKHSEVDSLRLSERQASDKYSRGQKDQEKIKEREESEALLNKIVSNQPEFETKRHQLVRAQRAGELVDLEQAMLSQQYEFNKLVEESTNAQKIFERTQIAQLQAVKALSFELKRSEERAIAHREQDRLNALQGQVQELEKARQHLQEVKQKETQAGHERDRLKVERDRKQEELNQLELDLTQIETVTKNLQLAKQAEADAQQIKEKWFKLHDVAVQWKVAGGNESKENENLQQTQINLNLAREKRDILEDAWHIGQAAIFASQLLENTPCPVCGSIDHPQPAKSDRPLPLEIDLKNARANVATLEKQLMNIQDKLSRLHDDTVRLDEARRPLIEFLRDKAHLKQIQIDTDFSAAQSNLQRVEEEARRLSGLKLKVDPYKKSLADAETKFANANRLWQEALNALTSAQAIFSERESKIPPELNDEDKLHFALVSANAIINQLEQAWQDAQSTDTKTKQLLASAEAIAKEKNGQVVEGKQRAEETAEKFMGRLKDAKFLDLEDYHSAKLTLSKINFLDNEIREYEGQLSAASERFKRAVHAAECLPVPDLEELKTEWEDIRVKFEAALEVQQELRTQKGNCDQYIKQFTKIQEDFETNEKLYAVIGKIANVANGTNAYNLTFQRFVLSSLLDDVLSDATQRLKIMSRGRYILQRAQLPLDKRRASGLDLVISDTWTGDSTRPVETLSGGEGFYTSLALALGLAEVVQHYAGGIRLDTIFIDEGFGSLDSDTLDLAIRTLEGLKESGRLVGIISHVESLRERIPARIEVTPGIKGSYVRQVIG